MTLRTFAHAALAGCALLLLQTPAYAAVRSDATSPFVDRALTAVRGIPDTGSNPVIPGPAIVRPDTPSCTVTLANAVPFENFTPYVGSYTPPASCAGPYSKIVFDWNVSVSGVQFDRLGAVWIGGTEIFHFTTSEPPGPQITWHAEKDVTEYASTLATAQPFTISLGNVVNSQYTGIYTVTATLTYYGTSTKWPAAVTPDLVAPISNGGSSPPWFTLNTPSNQASATLNLPTNIEGAKLEVYTTGHGCDEFWYAQESTAYEQSIGQTCGGTAYREIDVTVDGTLAGVIVPFEYLYTGAINPSLWDPITGHDTLDVPPYEVDLGPFVGSLTNGQPHTIALYVYNNFGYWVADADLLITEDHGSTQTSGKLTAASSGPTAIEHYNESNLNTVGGTASYHAEHHVMTAGYVNTSHGRIKTQVDQRWNFVDHQRFHNSGTYYFYTSMTHGLTTDTVTAHGGPTTTTTDVNYPFAIRKPAGEPLVIDQDYYQNISVNGARSFNSTKSATIHALGTSAETTERYVLTNSKGYCYDQLLTSKQRMLVTNKLEGCK
jgi:peptide N-acetyl-beta-D-glucosaminyl asparaginase amidase A